MTTPPPRPPFKPRREIHSHGAHASLHTEPPRRAPRAEGAVQAPDAVGLETTGMRSRRLEHERLRVKRRRRNRRIRSAFVILLVLVLLGGAGWFAINQVMDSSSQSAHLADDYPGPGEGSVEVTVDVGESGMEIGQTLVNAGVVKSLDAFTRAFNANKASTSIRPGTYTLKLKMSASEAVAALLDDANRSENTVTVAPGQTAAQIVERIVAVTDFTQEEVDSALADSAAIGLPAEAGGNAEGWLAPGSYELASTDTPATLLGQMVAKTVAELDALGVAAADRQAVLIKASILEREVNIDEYLPKVARVIENRLADPEGETKGLLQMDSTVLYGVGKTGGVPTVDDLADENPYNTYLHKGLPPTPIAQPAKSAIEAVISPAQGPWLYYVTVDLDTGETLFAQTHAEQEANVEKFKAYCVANPGKC